MLRTNTAFSFLPGTGRLFPDLHSHTNSVAKFLKKEVVLMNSEDMTQNCKVIALTNQKGGVGYEKLYIMQS